MANLDRVITINVQGEGQRVEGKWVDGAVTPYRVWASRRDISQTDIAAEDGDRDVTRRDFRIRWRSEFADALVSSLTVIEGGQTFNVLNLMELSAKKGGAVPVRRRFLYLQGERST